MSFRIETSKTEVFQMPSAIEVFQGIFELEKKNFPKKNIFSKISSKI